jgi:hypothetical protein
LVPEARVAAMPPARHRRWIDGKEQAMSAQLGIELLAGDASPTVTSRSSAPIRSTRRIWLRSIEMPPSSAATWPSSEVPVP